ncbi:uncharacterized protein LOC143917631 [Arctopsyche grandis]|uniref:uncharacterized protein LOC143917631 n=1 Tax=Arctopsyche grandis TaxID=121162 RepID=UPI00406D98E4
MPSKEAVITVLITAVAVFAMINRITPVGALPLQRDAAEDIITGQEFLTLLGSHSNKEHLVYDINKKEAPRIHAQDGELSNLHDDVILSDSQDRHTPISRNSRSNKEESRENSLKNEPIPIKKEDISDDDDLHFAGSSYYRENENNERLKNTYSSSAIPSHFDDDTPKIIGVRVTSSVAVGRGNKSPRILINQDVSDLPNADEIRKKSKIIEAENKYSNDSPTTWRPPALRFLNHEYYKGASSNRHSISTLPGPLGGANEDYIQQQKERELARKKPEVVHPYQRSIIYHGNSRDSQRPRSFSYSSVINTFGDSKLTTVNDWISSTKADSVATEATAGYVTIINHNGDNRVDAIKEIVDTDIDLKSGSEVKASKINAPAQIIPSLPIVYGEPAKIYSEPAKIYSEPAKIYGKPEEIYSEPAKVYSEPAKNYGEPSKVYSEPAKVYGEPAKIYGEPSKVYSQPAAIYHSLPTVVNKHESQSSKTGETSFEQNAPGAGSESDNANSSQNQTNDTKAPQTRGRSRGSGEQNYEVDESISVMTNGRTHGVQDKADEDGQKVGYVVEGNNYRKYRVEKRTPDGFIVGEYGVVSHDDGSLRGVRYTADGTTNPRLIHDALMKFLSL